MSMVTDGYRISRTAVSNEVSRSSKNMFLKIKWYSKIFENQLQHIIEVKVYVFRTQNLALSVSSGRELIPLLEPVFSE